MIRITILGEPINYKGFNILIQNFGEYYQYIIFHKGSFYQSYMQISNKGKRMSREQLIKAYSLLLDQAKATCELILHKKDPEKLLQENEQGSVILDILEDAEAANKRDKAIKVTEEKPHYS